MIQLLQKVEKLIEKQYVFEIHWIVIRNGIVEYVVMRRYGSRLIMVLLWIFFLHYF